MIDEAMAYELVEEWLPDFLAYADRPQHVLAPDLLAQARRRIYDSYEANTTFDDPNLTWDKAPEQIRYAAYDVATILEAVAEWIIANPGTPLIRGDNA